MNERIFMQYDYIVIGAGLAGATAARLLADKGNKVLVAEKLSHVGGSVYDCYDESGILIHKYGPHIFHTNDKEVYDFLCRFADFNGYEHRVAAKLDSCMVPVPFNCESLRRVYGEKKAQALRDALKKAYGTDTVSIMALMESDDDALKELGEFVYKNIFLYYTMKQWEKAPSEIDPRTTARVPVRLSEDDRYFTDKYQGLPIGGYTEMIKKMLSSEYITVKTDYTPSIELKDGRVFIDGTETGSKVVYTGELDRLLSYRYGHLPYRTLDFVFETHNTDSYQSHATVNYTVSEKFTRISEFKKMTLQNKEGVTTVLKEFSRKYEGGEADIPYYPVSGSDSEALYETYKNEVQRYPQIILLGRLAEYKYYNMDAVVRHVIDVLADK